MKKLIAFLLLLPVLAWAGPGYMVFDSNAVPVAASCTTSNDDDLGFTILYGDADDSYRDENYRAAQFTTSTADYVTGYIVRAFCQYDLGSTYDPIFSIYTDSADKVGTIVSNSSVTLDVSNMTLDTTYRDIEIDLPSAIQLSASTTYWIVVDPGSAGENYVRNAQDTSSTGGRIGYKNSGTWADASYTDNRTLRLKVLGCHP